MGLFKSGKIKMLLKFKRHLQIIGCVISLMVLLTGCGVITTDRSDNVSQAHHKTFTLTTISLGKAKSLLSDLNLNIDTTEPNIILVGGSEGDLHKAGIILELIDTDEQYIIQPLAPASFIRNIPSNEQITEVLGNITIGTFAFPPQSGIYSRAIIDLNGDAVLAVLPERFWQDTKDIVKLGVDAFKEQNTISTKANQIDNVSGQSITKETLIETDSEPNGFELLTIDRDEKLSKSTQMESVSQEVELQESSVKKDILNEPDLESVNIENNISQQQKQEHDASVVDNIEKIPTTATGIQNETNASEGNLNPIIKDASVPVNENEPPDVFLSNGNEVLELSLPDKIGLIELIDLVSEYLELDCVYDEEKIKNQVITLKLHSKMRNEISLKELYSLLETVLKFKGFVMTRQKGNLVTIVPADDVMTIDPDLIHPSIKTLDAGDMVVTRVFELNYVDVTGVANLLQNMKLGVVVSAIKETQTLFVTCYTHHIGRIEQLVSMVDKPGKTRKFKLHQLRYTIAKTVAKKIETIIKELRVIPLSTSQIQKTQPELSLKISAFPLPSQQQDSGNATILESSSKQMIYLDTDERTNRILIIGLEEQIAIIEELIDVLDVPEQDLRILKTYEIRYINAEEMKKKLEELEIIGKDSQTQGTPQPIPSSGPLLLSKTNSTDTSEGILVREPQVVVLATTNSLLINATKEQHIRIETIINYVDVGLVDTRILKKYHIVYTNAEEVKKTLEELEIIDMDASHPNNPEMTSTSNLSPVAAANNSNVPNRVLPLKPQVVALTSKNSLLINATDVQHAYISTTISYIDIETRKEAIPYEVYFLENQTPKNLAEILEKIIKETSIDDQDKIQKATQKDEDDIRIVPDETTFSLIVYGDKKDQEWVSKLIKILDKRRPQVLIDATLVEIRKTDEFNYDLNLISSFPDLAETGGQTDSFQVGDQTVVEKLLEPGMRDRFIDFQVNSGSGTGFYADMHINALLKIIQTKNYGRVLAKPKVLVNDNETGTIRTVDTTYVEKKTSIPVTSGSAGQQNTLIETATDFEQYDAGIKLEITPHISEGDLLRLEIGLSRSDFGTITGTRPPDQTSSDVNTVVTVPDGSTIILGGMLKLNQNKGGTKVPILGDLPLLGLLFRSAEKSDIQSKLYIFVRAEIIRPTEALAGAHKELERVSQQNREAFEKHEEEFQNYQSIPGLKPTTTEPAKILEAN